MSWLVFISLACVLDRTSQSAPAQMQREIRDNAVRVYNVEQQFVQVEARVNQLEELNRSSGKRKILQMETLEEVRGEVVKLRGALEVLTHDAEQGSKDLKGTVEDARFRVLWLETRADQLERSLGMKTPPPPAMPTEAPSPGDTQSGETTESANNTATTAAGSDLPVMPVGASDGVADAAPAEPPVEPESTTEAIVDPVTEPALDPGEVLNTVKKQLKKGNHVGAETLLNRFLDAFPNHARADEATYRRAEASKVAGDYEKAVLRYQEVIDQFKASSFAPWAMLRQGEVFDAQGQKDNANVFYGEVIRIYPKTRAAKAARKALSK